MRGIPEPEEAIIVRPGDRLVLRFKPPITQEIADMIRDRVRCYAPELADVLVVECEQMAVIRKESNA